MPYKICRKCGDPKDTDDFPDDKDTSDGKSSWCKKCKADDEAARRLEKGAKPRRKRDPTLLAKGLKECFGPCGQVLPLDDFSPSPTGVGGRVSVCKKCKADENAARRKK